MIAAVVRNRSELIGATNELAIGIGIAAAGVAIYFLSEAARRKNAANL
jgi:hypothetical protein